MAAKKKAKPKVPARIQLSFACDLDLRDAFVQCCKEQDTSSSRELRSYMKRYLAKHGQKDLF
ncbi:MAG: hypothetical protein JKY01_04555 [Pseudomonadales bacterium]|nr:hypothetical protein [Pseudomonadales bacterium]